MARRHRPAQCVKCRQPIKWASYHGSWRKLEPRPVDPRTHNGPRAYPIEGSRLWMFPALVEELMGRRECGRAEAEDEAYDMPWHTPHVCPDNDTEQEAPR